MSTGLPIDLYSPDQLSVLMLELYKHTEALRNNRARTRVTKKSDSTPPVTALLLEVLKEFDISVDDLTAAEQLLPKLELIRSKALVVHVILATPPNEDLRHQITQWFRTEIHPLLFLTFAARRDIGGGMLLRAGSHQYDFSFRKQLLDNKAKISEIFIRLQS
ncbi:MAG TPA: hypothetical protein VNX65_00345 [Patescibacteria group bacterium]|jgi:F0F1-type ATP synthase delta subunit|nr:hypothetical protein [Patescibacteria group bacterium]